MPTKKSSKQTTQTTRKRKRITPAAQAKAVLAFLNSDLVPDFLSTAVVITIDRACEHLDPDPFKLRYEPGGEYNDSLILTALCKRTKMLSIEDMENTQTGVARHLAAIITNPQTPGGLREAVLEFVCNTQNAHPYGKPSLAEEMTRDVGLLKRVIERAREDEEAPDD